MMNHDESRSIKKKIREKYGNTNPDLCFSLSKTPAWWLKTSKTGRLSGLLWARPRQRTQSRISAWFELFGKSLGSKKGKAMENTMENQETHFNDMVKKLGKAKGKHVPDVDEGGKRPKTILNLRSLSNLRSPKRPKLRLSLKKKCFADHSLILESIDRTMSLNVSIFLAFG